MKITAMTIMIGSVCIARCLNFNIYNCIFGFIIGVIIGILAYMDVLRDNNYHI